MTQEEKQLLLQDLCARLPYNTKADITYSKEHGSSDRLRICSEGCLILNTDVLGLYIEDEIYIKPYLRPMPSMDGTEVLEYIGLKESIVASDGATYSFETDESIDWLNANHFDYRGLIGKGLALEAPEGMYKSKND